jgi:hypothetical protein
VIVTKSGVNAGAVFGAKVTSFPFDLIAVIEVTTSGVRTALIVRSAGDRGSSDVWSSPNMVPFNRSDRERAQRFANHATEVRTSGKPRAEATASVADELVKLASLRDAGVLSEDEFAAQKAKLLS